MDKLRAIQIFTEVAQSRSFSAAARRLGMAPSNVTKYVAWLERSLGVPLLSRTTKSVALTEAGVAMLENGREVLDKLEEMEAVVRSKVKQARGTLRVGTPPSFGAFHLVEATTAFSRRHPEVEVAFHADFGESDLVAEGLDISIRIAKVLKDSNCIAYPLTTVPQQLVASADYLRQFGTPTSVGDLVQHNCLVHALKAPTSQWEFTGPEGRITVRVRGTIRSNFGEALRLAAIQGSGIAMHPTYMVAADLQAGTLKVVLPSHQPTGLDIFALAPQRNQPIRVRTYLEFLQDWFRTPRWERPAGTA